MFGKTIVCPKIQGRKLILKPFEKESLPLIAEWVNDQEISRYLASDNGYSLSQEEQWYEKTMTRPDNYKWGIFLGEKLIGNTSLMKIEPIHRNATYGILIGDKSAWGKGIGTEVAKAVSAYGFSRLNLNVIYGDAFVSNIGSIKALERAGFTSYGIRPAFHFIDNQYHDIWLGSLSRKG
jgi:RimJ/RimL family protein N-acetyltransferase